LDNAIIRVKTVSTEVLFPTVFIFNGQWGRNTKCPPFKCHSGFAGQLTCGHQLG